MAGLTDILTPLVTVLNSVPGITTVYTYPTETPGQPGTLPEVILDVKSPRTGGGKTTTRRVDWPIDIWIRTEERPVEIADALPNIYPLPDAVFAALDAAGTFNGTLATTVHYDEPAVSSLDPENPFAAVRNGDRQFMETCIHAIFTVDRVGGFGNG